MKKLILLPLLVLLVSSLIFGGLPSSARASSPTQAWKWPHTLTVGTAGVPTANYAVTCAWGGVMEKRTGMKVRVIPEGVDPLRCKWLKDSTIDVGYANLSNYAALMEGVGGFSELGPFQVRYLWNLGVTPYGFMVRGDSPLKTLYDLKPGMKVAVPTFSENLEGGTYASLAWAKLSKEDMKLVPFGSYGPYVRSVAEGKADVVFCATISSVTYEVEGAPQGIRWLAYSPGDKEGLARFLDIAGSYTIKTATKGVKSCHGVAIPHIPLLYEVSSTMSTDLAYHLAKWLDENFGAYKDAHKLIAGGMSIDLVRSVLDVAFSVPHDGLVKYLKEKGMWDAKDDAWFQKNLKLLERYIKAHEGAIADAKEKGIKVRANNDEWLRLWQEHKKGLPRFKIKF